MKPQLVTTETSLPINIQTKQDLFNRFGGMLLGYLSEVVKSSTEAEKYLVDIFSQLQFAEIEHITSPGKNTFIRLQAITRKKMEPFIAAIEDCADEQPAIKGNKFIDMMAPQQQQVFCGIHYHGKTTAKVAAELNKTEAEVRQLLKEAFNIIRSNR